MHFDNYISTILEYRGLEQYKKSIINMDLILFQDMLE